MNTQLNIFLNWANQYLTLPHPCLHQHQLRSKMVNIYSFYCVYRAICCLTSSVPGVHMSNLNANLNLFGVGWKIPFFVIACAAMVNWCLYIQCIFIKLLISKNPSNDFG